MSNFPKGEENFNKWLVEQYLMYGSVDEVLRIYRYGIPISYAGYQRVLNRFRIVKAAGPNSKLTEVIDFFTHLAEKNIPFEKLYRSMPPRFQTSMATLYRVLSYVKEGVTRRIGTGLVLTPFGDDQRILVGRDVSTPRIELGKPYGSISIPMGFSRKRDPREQAILRVLQQEVFAQLAINEKIPDIISFRPKPFMFLDIADIRVEIFHLRLPKKYSDKRCFSSFKLKGFKFMSIEKILNKKSKINFRIGVKEIAQGHQKYLNLKGRNLSVNPLQYKSEMNYQLVEVVDQ